MIKRYIVPVAAVVLVSVQMVGAQMKLEHLAEVEQCQKAESQSVDKLMATGRGGAGGSVFRWQTETDSLIVYPGKTSVDNNGAPGTSIDQALQAGSVARLTSSENGLVVRWPGYVAVIPWKYIDDLKRKSVPNE